MSVDAVSPFPVGPTRGPDNLGRALIERVANVAA